MSSSPRSWECIPPSMPKTAPAFLTAKNLMGPFVVGVLVMSEFIGTAATLGTAQTAFVKGISAAWNLVGMGVGFFLYGLFIAPKLNALKEYTISGAVGQQYGSATRMAVSGIMTYALIVVNVSMFTGGAATLSLLLGVSIKSLRLHRRRGHHSQRGLRRPARGRHLQPDPHVLQVRRAGAGIDHRLEAAAGDSRRAFQSARPALFPHRNRHSPR